MKETNQHHAVIERLTRRLPASRRRNNLQAQLDATVPDWDISVRTPEFFQWAVRVDSENGTCMLDRVQTLLDDPVYAADDLALILRMYSRAAAIRTPPREGRLPVLAGKYELIQQLGRGGCGEVYLVWSTETEKFYALKTIRSELTRGVGARQSFRQEAFTWIAMGEHPNVAKAYFFEEVGSSLYVTMSYVEGDDDGRGASLSDKLSAGSVPVERLCVWFCQVADGLNHGYASGLRAHRDIKPGNILINRLGVAQISDFGLAVSSETLIAAGVDEGLVGTPLFMSPEQFVNSAECNQQSDIYALGVTLYQAASGGAMPFMPRFLPKTPADMRRFFLEVRMLQAKAQPPPLSSPLWPIISRCLSKNPADRFPDVTSFRSQLGSLAKQLGIEVTAPATKSQDFWALRDQGNSFMRLRQYEKALKCFDGFLAALPDDNTAFNRAVCLENLGRFEEALPTYEKSARNGDIKGLVNVGNCLRALGRKVEAYSYAQQAVNRFKDDADCWLALGNAAFSLEKWTEAIRAYESAQSLEPSASTPSYNLGLAAQRAGLAVRALEAFSMFMRVSMPDDQRREYVEKALSRLGSAR